MPRSELAHISARLTALLLVAVAVLKVVGDFVPAYPDWMTGVLGWMACVLFWPRLKTAQRCVALFLLVFVAAGIAWGALYWHGGMVTGALIQSMPPAGILIAVSFLQQISTRQNEANEPSSIGRYAPLSTPPSSRRS